MSSAAGHKERSRVLVIGGTGYIGRFIVAASAREGHPTYVLVRDPAPADPAKAAVLQGFRDAGVTLVKVYCSCFHYFPLSLDLRFCACLGP
jgi:nucleoside-diphosphate-sugar epimerase